MKDEVRGVQLDMRSSRFGAARRINGEWAARYAAFADISPPGWEFLMSALRAATRHAGRDERGWSGERASASGCLICRFIGLIALDRTDDAAAAAALLDAIGLASPADVGSAVRRCVDRGLIGQAKDDDFSGFDGDYDLSPATRVEEFDVPGLG